MFVVYKVKEGDTLSKIAKAYNTTTEYIASINNFDPLYTPPIGKEIIVPNNTPNIFKHYEVKKGDTISSIAKAYNCTVAELLEVNGLDRDDFIYPGEIIVIPRKGIETYTTKEGDTLKGISEQFNVSQCDIAKNNDSIFLYPDQILIYKEL